MSDPQIDLESLLEPNEQLYIEAVTPGSWYITLWTKTKGSLHALYVLASMFYGRAREAALGKLEADRRLKDLEVEEKEFELAARRAHFALGLAEKVTDPAAQAAIRRGVETNLAQIFGSKASRDSVRQGADRLLMPPASSDD